MRYWKSGVHIILLTTIIALIQVQAKIVFHEQLLGSVGGGNYTYYSLTPDGGVLILLHSLLGDADLYVSEKRLKPTFDLASHDLQSVSCGLDKVEIPWSFGRPIGIGVYGHPSHEISMFELEVMVDDTPEWVYPEEYMEIDENNKAAESRGSKKRSSSYSSDSKNQGSVYASDTSTEEESILWAIFVGILKLFLEVIVS
ncbi:UPF0669 protein C6orf120 homolog [Tachypleus tridentatus]|uniref:UPF0669 protein C6orf120 homolog n=1 Tax=Tachypleus tridentatus TaxID=6853 RepID=UPI003FD22054